MIKPRKKETSTSEKPKKSGVGKAPLVSVMGKVNKTPPVVAIEADDLNKTKKTEGSGKSGKVTVEKVVKLPKKSLANKVKKESITKRKKGEVAGVGIGDGMDGVGVEVSSIKELQKERGDRLARRAKMAEDEGEGTMAGFPIPKIGELCIMHMKEAKIVDVNKPAIGFVTFIRDGETRVMGLAELWRNINQERGYYKATKQKHDWDAIKQDFFESDYMDILPFLKYTYGIDVVQNGGARERTKGWGDEKKALQKEIKQKAFEEFKTTLKKQWDGVFEKLEFAHVQGLEHLANMILDQGKITKRKILRTMKDPETGENLGKEVVDQDIILPYLTHGDITAILKHIKLEKGEPTDIVDTQGKSEARAWLDDLKKQKEGEKKV